MHVKASITIQRDPATVFRWIEDPELARRWHTSETVGFPPAPGAEGGHEQVIAAEGDRRWFRGRVTAYVPNERIDIDDSRGGVRDRISYTLAPHGTGTVLRARADIRGPGAAAVAMWLFRWMMPLALKQELRLLRELCEAEQA